MGEIVSSHARKSINELPLSGIELLLHLSENHPALSLGIGEPNFDTPTHIVKAATEALEHGYTHYSPDSGLKELRDAIAEKTGRDNGFEPDPNDEILVTGGTSPAVFGAIQTLIDSGDEVIIPTPSYFAYNSIVRIFGGKSVLVPTREEDGFVPDSEAMKKAISPKTKMLVICSPNNPNGAVWNEQQLKNAVDLAEDHNLILLSDEIYEKIVFDNAKHYSPASIGNAFERTITINGLSKSHAMTGFRIGWIIATKDIISNFRKIHQYSTICAPVISQKAAVAALNGPQNCVDAMVTDYAKRRQLMVNRFNRDVPLISAVAPKGSFFMFINIKQLIENHLATMKGRLRSEGMKTLVTFPKFLFSLKDLDSSGSLVSMLYLALFANVLTASGGFFGPGGEGYLRVSFAQTYEMIEKAIDLLVDSITKLK
jgi:aspartate/methionine/tyrosine aminotransferase